MQHENVSQKKMLQKREKPLDSMFHLCYYLDRTGTTPQSKGGRSPRSSTSLDKTVEMGENARTLLTLQNSLGLPDRQSIAGASIPICSLLAWRTRSLIHSICQKLKLKPFFCPFCSENGLERTENETET
jgi:hypothetical protein